MMTHGQTGDPLARGGSSTALTSGQARAAEGLGWPTSIDSEQHTTAGLGWPSTESTLPAHIPHQDSPPAAPAAAPRQETP